jgi:hypothetical protein
MPNKMNTSEGAKNKIYTSARRDMGVNQEASGRTALELLTVLAVLPSNVLV